MCALLIGVSTTGCALIEAEKNNRGGFLDEIADDHWMKADSKKMRALRAITIEASLARIAMIAPKSASDRSLLARRIGETTKRADMVRQCAFSELQLPGQLSSEPCFFFDSVMVDYENALFDLALVALPIDEAKTLITRVTGGIASVTVNPLELVQTLLNIGREAFRYGRVVGAIYRDTLELEVQVWLASPNADERVADLARIYARGNDNIPEWRAAIAALRAQGLEPVPQQRFILQLYGIIGYICGQIVTPNPADPAYTECARPDLRAKLPLVNVSAGRDLVLSGLGAGGVRGGGGGAATQQLKGQLEQTKQQQQALAKQLDDVQRKQDELQHQQQRLAIGPIEPGIKAPVLLAIKKALCVTGPDASSDIFDEETRDRLRDFVSGIAWAPAILQGGAKSIDQTMLGRLTIATKISAACSPDSLISSAYELGVYARSGTQAVNVEVESALKCLALDSALRGREAFKRLRLRFEQAQTGLAQGGAAQPGAPAQLCPVLPALPSTAGGRSDLEPALWAFVTQKSREWERRNQSPTPR